jgi:hypothetical protein
VEVEVEAAVVVEAGAVQGGATGAVAAGAEGGAEGARSRPRWEPPSSSISFITFCCWCIVQFVLAGALNAPKLKNTVLFCSHNFDLSISLFSYFLLKKQVESELLHVSDRHTSFSWEFLISRCPEKN